MRRSKSPGSDVKSHTCACLPHYHCYSIFPSTHNSFSTLSPSTSLTTSSEVRTRLATHRTFSSYLCDTTPVSRSFVVDFCSFFFAEFLELLTRHDGDNGLLIDHVHVENHIDELPTIRSEIRSLAAYSQMYCASSLLLLST